ncbi:serine/threonine protein kinase [Spongiactinospora sp. 9N601]|uniref:serine/threonine protein kinase n=1 Tax=Spongiactinospora sp. 9N601 TaxID=3375149 RepID=UPI0037B71658
MTHQAHPPAALLPLSAQDPHQIGPYRVVGRLGAGGMGVVFAGLDPNGTRTAVKLVHASFAADPEFRARFAREISVLQRVNGMCTARILGCDPDAVAPWLAAEYVPGPTLENRVRSQGALQRNEWFGLMAGLAEALVAVHAVGVVHRDLKPSNVILSPSGPKLVDFGIARVLDGTAMTRTGALVGSPGWVSPEEYGDTPVDAAADVYGWALIAVYAASGKPPYGIGRPEVLAMRAMTEPVDTSSVPAPLRALIDKALAKKPSFRPSVQEILTTIVETWRGHHGEQAIEGRTAIDDLTARLDRTWIMPAADPAWPTPSALAPRGTRRRTGLSVLILAIVLGTGVGAAIALKVLPQGTGSQARSSGVSTATSLSAPATTGTDQHGTAPPSSAPPPQTSADLAAALDLAFAATPAANFSFEGGFTQSNSGGLATGRLVSRQSHDDLDFRVNPYDEGVEPGGRYVVLASSTVYPGRPGSNGEDLSGMQPAHSAWYALMIAGTASPSTIREVVANSTRMKRKGRAYSGVLAIEKTSGRLRDLLGAWLGGDVAEVSPTSYITYKLTIDSQDRPKNFRLTWCVPVGNAGIYESDFTTVYRGWKSNDTIKKP